MTFKIIDDVVESSSEEEDKGSNCKEGSSWDGNDEVTTLKLNKLYKTITCLSSSLIRSKYKVKSL